MVSQVPLGMGCCASKNLDPELPPTLGAGVEQLSTVTPDADIAAVRELLVRSFSGAPGTRPEASLSWCLGDANAADRETPGDHYSKRTVDAPAETIAAIGWVIDYGLACSVRHGGVFVLRDDDGKIVAATACYAPNDAHLHDPGMCDQLALGVSMPPAVCMAPRMTALGKAMGEAHKACASGPHVYVSLFATATGEQGKGYGKRMLTHIAAWADHLGVPTYLETTGEGNVKFYGKLGFEVAQKLAVSAGGDSYDGCVAMVRKPASSDDASDSSGNLGGKTATVAPE